MQAAELTVRIVDAEEGQRLNREFRHKDYPTNVRTFDYSGAPAVMADLVLCAPLAFMRGRTLNNAFIILDEAQNTTPEQMKMFLTRIGFGAKAVVTGDVSQIDLPKGATSGLIDAERVLRRVKGLAFNRFTSADVVRHPLVARIVDAYDAAPRQSSDTRGA